MFRRSSLVIVLGMLMTAVPAELRADVFHMSPELVSLDFVAVGNEGNEADTTGYGAVADAFAIGRFEVTAAQYAEFLTAVAATDAYGLYDYNMTGATYNANIMKSGSPGSYSYSAKAGKENYAIGTISWGDAARFCNWLTNGQPTGAQDLSTTEDGSYYLNGATTDAELMAVTRKPGARYFIPSENEWYKAAYHCNDGPTGNYFAYPTANDTAPSSVLSDPDIGNTANYHGESLAAFCLVGDRENSASAYLTFDQGGNVWEWNETAVDASNRGLRGGSFGDEVDKLGSAVRHKRAPTRYYDSWSNDVGFRVASIPEPSAIIAVLSGVLFLLFVRCCRRRAT